MVVSTYSIASTVVLTLRAENDAKYLLIMFKKPKLYRKARSNFFRRHKIK